MLDVILADEDITIGIVSESVILHSDLLDIYEEVSEDVHYLYMCESTSALNDGISRIKEGIKNLFARLRRFIKTIIDNIMSMFSKKIRATNGLKERIRSVVKDSNSNIIPFNMDVRNYVFKDNLDSLFNLANRESEAIANSIKDILSKNQDMDSDITNIKNHMSSEDTFNKLRRDILNLFRDVNVGALVPKSQYIEELQLSLRGGDLTPSNKTITKEILAEIIAKDDEQITIRRNLERYKNNITIMFNTLENDYNKAVKIVSDETWKINARVNSPIKNIDGSKVQVFDEYQFDYSQSLLKTLNDLFNTSVVYFKNLSDITSIALSEYAKAVSESMDTNKEIFKTALGNVERGL